jgi:hypothetical protein
MKNITETGTLWLSDIKPVASAWKRHDHNVIIPRYNIRTSSHKEE